MVQFCSVGQLQYHLLSFQTAYPAHDSPAALAVPHHIACAFAHATRCQPSLQRHPMPTFLQSRPQLLAKVHVFVVAVQCILDKLAAIFQQIGPKLPARTRQIMQRVEIELSGELAYYPARLNAVSIHQRRWSQVHG
jgi:hypothetical protein